VAVLILLAELVVDIAAAGLNPYLTTIKR